MTTKSRGADALDAEVASLAASTRALLSTDPADPDPEAAGRLLGRLGTTVERISDAFLESGTSATRAADLCERLVEVHELQSDLREHTLGLRFQTLTRIHDTLAELRRVETPAELLDAAPAALCACGGFNRALLSRIRGSTWVPRKFHVVDDPDSAVNRAVLEFLDGREIPLNQTLLEAELVRRRAPALVEDAPVDQRTYHPLIEVSGSHGYVAAPIVTSGPVIGLWHADTYGTGRRLTTFDRDNLQTFAEGFGLIYERAVLVERLETQHRHITEAFASTDKVLADLRDTHVHLARRAVESRVTASPALMLSAPESRIQGVLTPREREVLGLMAGGATNNQIADQLVISEGTVKSHVKHILRKLRASNRAEAVSRYLRLARHSQRPA
ncbi:MAG: response regulator transcription factor [Solirubrobacteraceae bacterium]